MKPHATHPLPKAGGPHPSAGKAHPTARGTSAAAASSGITSRWQQGKQGRLLKKVLLTRPQRFYLDLCMVELRYGTAQAQNLEKLAQEMGGHAVASQKAPWKG